MGAHILYKRISLLITAKRAVGYFVRWEQRGLRKMHYYLVVRFHAQDGKEYEFVGEPSASSKRERKQYSIFYPADNPKAAMIHSFIAYWLSPLVFFILAAGSGFAALKQ